MGKRKHIPAKIKAVPESAPPEPHGAHRGVLYCAIEELSEEETVQGLLDGTIREASRDAHGNVTVQIVPRHLAWQTIDGVSPDALFMHRECDDDFELNDESLYGAGDE